MSALYDVHSALLQRGFKAVRQTKAVCFEGHLKFRGRKVAARVHISDTSFIKFPRIQILERPDELPKVCAHIDEHGFLCYARHDLAYLPRNNLGGGVLGCLEVAEKLLESLAGTQGLTGTQDEFPVYWDALPLLVDIPRTVSEGLLTDVALLEVARTDESPHMFLLGQQIEQLKATYEQWGFTEFSSKLSLRVIDTSQPLGAMEEHWPPSTLEDIEIWLKKTGNPAWRGVHDSLKDAHKHRLNFVMLMIRGPNTSCCFTIDVKYLLSNTPRRNSEEFARAILNSAKLMRRATIRRYRPIPVDPDSWLTRNSSDGSTGLAGKKILLMGCGAIGGYLTDLLAKAGAGFLGGSLLLADPDYLFPGNLGRHILGFDDLLKRKTDGLLNKLRSQYPYINAEAVSEQPFIKSNMAGIDLVIDATGNSALSLFLSELKVKTGFTAPVLFSWIAGAGCGAQAYLFSGRDSACLHCLDYARAGGDFSVMAHGYEMSLKNAAGSCGDWLVPFSAPAAVHAAALAAELASDWVKGNPSQSFKSITLDHQYGKVVKPKTPKPNKQCCICS